MASIKTYVFMHIETTGLPSQERNETRITELGMVALRRKYMTPSPNGQLPRVVHKLTMCFNPGKNITPGAKGLSGLSEDLIRGEKVFNSNAASTIKTFLEYQEKPVCLVAHNGYKFGFPLLQNHFHMWETYENGWPGIMCVDSRLCFYEILRNPINCVARFQDEPHKIPRSIDDVLKNKFYENDESPEQWLTLNSIYELVFQRPGIGPPHTAEIRSKMIAEMSMAHASEFVKWVDNNYCAFSEVEPLLSHLHFLL